MTESVRQAVMFAAVAASAAGMWLATSPRAVRWRILGATLASAGLIAAVVTFEKGIGGSAQALEDQIMFWTFAAAAIFSGAFMVTSRDPVYAALWFALATLGVCGLFMLQAAPFLAAATIIVYAGAIIVTFLFVIMLAQQTGRSFYDQRARTPIMAIVASWLMLGALLWNFQKWQAVEPVESTGPAMTVEVASNPLSRPENAEAINTLRALGRSLFGDYLYAVEICGTLLLIAAIGAIAIAPRRAEGTI
jgi:NADH-quinone oxidoreductase subunit J